MVAVIVVRAMMIKMTMTTAMMDKARKLMLRRRRILDDYLRAGCDYHGHDVTMIVLVMVLVRSCLLMMMVMMMPCPFPHTAARTGPEFRSQSQRWTRRRRVSRDSREQGFRPAWRVAKLRLSCLSGLETPAESILIAVSGWCTLLRPELQ